MRTLTVVLALWPLAAYAQQAAPGPAFEVVSIKRSDPNARGGGIRFRPDGQMTMTNQGLSSIIRTVAPNVSGIIGMPAWMSQDRYDVVATPPPDTPRAQLQSMWRALWADRMKLVSHIESRQQPAFSLVLARGDGRLGPGMRPVAAARSVGTPGHPGQDRSDGRFAVKLTYSERPDQPAAPPENTPPSSPRCRNSSA